MKEYRRVLVRILFWGALLCCVVALVHQRDALQQLRGSLSGLSVVSITFALALMWGATVLAWGAMLHAWTGVQANFDVGARHLSLLLVGKYLPGGVWGFLSRHADAKETAAGHTLLLAGLSEQGVNLLVLLGLGGAALAYGSLGFLGAFATALLAIVLCMGGVLGSANVLESLSAQSWMAWVGHRWPSKGSQPQVSGVVRSVLWVVLQQILFLSVVAWVAFEVFGLGPDGAVKAAGAYGVAAAIGMLVVFAPGGIVAREGAFIALLGLDSLTAGDVVALAAFLRLLNCGYDFSTAPMAWISMVVARCGSKFRSG